MLAAAGRFTCTGVCDLVATARRAGYAEAEETADRYEDGVPFFRHDATITVAISVVEQAERGMPDDAVIGVAWGDGDQVHPPRPRRRRSDEQRRTPTTGAFCSTRAGGWTAVPVRQMTIRRNHQHRSKAPTASLWAY